MPWKLCKLSFLSVTDLVGRLLSSLPARWALEWDGGCCSSKKPKLFFLQTSPNQLCKLGVRRFESRGEEMERQRLASGRRRECWMSGQTREGHKRTKSGHREASRAHQHRTHTRSLVKTRQDPEIERQRGRGKTSRHRRRACSQANCARRQLGSSTQRRGAQSEDVGGARFALLGLGLVAPPASIGLMARP
ncbi:hypothetical protein C2845_PM03G18240 [Panicum miliaceum]|uniref:Uncharacterized protein n=1 Tax=Panicum miliaceum TaxID=4540 RepID=A0A3L6TGE1_PANMI|nr:hypothetical protein C2845_PM03G18240 [Panicum miliaceum]